MNKKGVNPVITQVFLILLLMVGLFVLYSNVSSITERIGDFDFDFFSPGEDSNLAAAGVECGNGEVEPQFGEACDCGIDGVCDFDELDFKDCKSFVYDFGDLGCTDSCVFDLSGCTDVMPEVTVSSCQELSEPDTLYLLDRDLLGSEVTAECLKITGEGSILDCQDHLVKNSNLEAIVIRSNANGVTIRNCEVEASNYRAAANGKGAGIYVRADNNVVQNNIVTGGFSGISLRGYGNIIEDNYIERTAKAIHIVKDNNLIRDNVMVDNYLHQGWGIGVWGGEGNQFMGNSITNSRYGVVLYDASDSYLGCNEISGTWRKDLYIYATPWYSWITGTRNDNIQTIGTVYDVKHVGNGAELIELEGGCYAIPKYQDDFEDLDYTVIDSSFENGMSWSTLAENTTTNDITAPWSRDDVDGNSLILKKNTPHYPILSDQIISGNDKTFEFKTFNIWAPVTTVLFLYKDDFNYYYLNFADGPDGIFRVMNGVEEKLSSELHNSGIISLDSAGESPTYKIYFNNDGNKIDIWVDKNGYDNGLDYEIKISDTDASAVSLFNSGKIGFAEGFDSPYTGVYYDTVKIYSGIKYADRPHPITTFYVDENGDDNNPGTSSQPFATVAKAASIALPEDNISINPGLYIGGEIPLANSGLEGKPITIKGSDVNNRPIIRGSIVKEIPEWELYSGQIYNTTIDWVPRILFYGEMPLLRANTPNQTDSEEGYDTDLYYPVLDAYNQLEEPENHHKLIDPRFTQADNYWIGCEIELYDNYYNSIGTFDVLESNQAENSIIFSNVDEGRNVTGGDSYALANCVQTLDDGGEYVVRKGELEVISFSENSGTLNVEVSMVGGIGTVSNVKFHLFNATNYTQVTNSSLIREGDSDNFELDISGLINGVTKVYATIRATDMYDLYAIPYFGQNLNEIEMTHYSDFISFVGFQNYINFENLDFEKFQGSPLDIDHTSARGFIIRDIETHHNGGSGIVCRGGCEEIIVDNVYVHHNVGRGILISGEDTSGHSVLNSEVAYNQNDGIYLGTGSERYGFVYDILIKNNRLHHQGLGKAHPDNLQMNGAINITIDSNYMFQEGHQNIWSTQNGRITLTNNIIDGGPIGLGGKEIFVYNNVLNEVLLRLDGQEIGLEETQFIDGDVKNNVMISSNIMYPFDHSDPEKLQREYMNDFIDTDYNMYFFDTHWPYWNIDNHSGYGDNSLVVYKLDQDLSLFVLQYFEDEIDYYPRAGTFPIDNGISSFPVSIENDRAGNPRQSGPAVDIGVWEY
jgi:parallel beta-helix repeat protein